MRNLLLHVVRLVMQLQSLSKALNTMVKKLTYGVQALFYIALSVAIFHLKIRTLKAFIKRFCLLITNSLAIFLTKFKV